MLVLEIKKRDLEWSRMTACQADAGAGVYAQALAGFVQRLARRYEQLQKDLQPETTRRRKTAPGAVTHRRIPTIIANLRVGLDYWLKYAEDSGALTKSEADTLWKRGLTALDEAAKTQMQHQDASEPTERFMELLRAAIVSGRAHIAGPDGEPPKNPEGWGWRSIVIGADEPARVEWRSFGDRIGWVDGRDLYLEPEASYAVAQRLARDGGDSITIGSKTLHKRLHEKGLLTTTEAGRHKLTVRRVLEGQRRAVLHLRADLISTPETAQ